MKIFSIYPKLNPIVNFETKNNDIKNGDTAGSIGYNSVPYYNTISFQARVDKGLKRFYEVNADRMPKTLKAFIEKLPDKEMFSPLNANKLAFSALAGVTTIAGIQAALPEDEELTQNIKDIDETNARRGILSTYRQYQDLFDKDKLVNGENLSVWLVKKIFLESKTIDEINEDFINEIDPDFYNFYRESEPEAQPIRHSTLNALGIKMPEKEYMTSLRYTREGYSDDISTIISIAKKNAWDRLSDDDKLNDAINFVNNTNKWWDSLPKDVKLDILASKDAELECAKLYNQHLKDKAEKREAKEKAKESSQTNTESKTQSRTKREHINTGIKRNDELFKIWLQKNLAIHREQLTEAEKREITIRQQQSRAASWEAMTPEEQIEYISRLKSGSEQLRFAMIDTWNNNPDILIKLSMYLKKQNIERPVDVLYGSKEFNNYQSQIMKDFWQTYPDFSTKLGDSIKEAHQKIKDAKKNDTFEELKQSILLTRAEREEYVKKYTENYREIFTDAELAQFPEYIINFINIYKEASAEYIKHLPKEYLVDFFNTVKNSLKENVVASWTKALNNEVLTLDDHYNIEQIKAFEPYEAKLMNRALEAAIADILFECTNDPQVYMMSQSDCKVALNQIDKGYEEIILGSEKTGKNFVFKIKNNKINNKKIEELYKYYKSPVKSVLDIISSYFFPKENNVTSENYTELENYISSYGKSIEKIFSLESKVPIDAKFAFLQKFLLNMPEQIGKNFECRLQDTYDLEKEEQINRINNKLIRKYNFIPQEMLNTYLFEIDQTLRYSNKSSLDNFEELCCKPRKNPQERGKIAMLRRGQLTDRGNLFTFLCIEQVLADVLYKATKESRVYSLNFEELIDNLEIFNLVKKYPSENRYIKPQNTGEEFQIRLLRKLPLYNLNKQTSEYMKELQEYTSECIKENKSLEKEEILAILSPYVGNPEIDEATMKRIEPIFDDLQKVVLNSQMKAIIEELKDIIDTNKTDSL